MQEFLLFIDSLLNLFCIYIFFQLDATITINENLYKYHLEMKLNSILQTIQVLQYIASDVKQMDKQIEFA